MKSERWQSSKSILLSFQDFKDELKTERQWAKAGYLPVSEDCGKKLRPSRFSTGSVSTLPRYLLPEEVRAASSDELAEYFKPERERKAAQAAKRRAKLRREREQEKEQARLLLALDEQREKVLTITQSVELPAETSGGIVIDTETTGLCAGEDEGTGLRQGGGGPLWQRVRHHEGYRRRQFCDAQLPHGCGLRG